MYLFIFKINKNIFIEKRKVFTFSNAQSKQCMISTQTDNNIFMLFFFLYYLFILSVSHRFSARGHAPWNHEKAFTDFIRLTAPLTFTYVCTCCCIHAKCQHIFVAGNIFASKIYTKPWI